MDCTAPHPTMNVMRWFFAISLCACGSAGGSDAAVDAQMDAASACLYVRAGSTDGDGTAAAPFGTLDDAIDVAVAGDELCLAGGEHAPPTRSIDLALTITGAGSTGPDAAVINGVVGSCLRVSVPNAFEESRIDVGVALASSASLTLREVVVAGCDIGVFVQGDLRFERSVVDRVHTGIFGERANIEILLSRIRAGSLPFLDLPFGVIRAAVASLDGSVLVHESHIEGGAASFGIYAIRSDLDAEALTIDGGSFGIWANNVDDATRTIGIDGSIIRGLRNLDGRPSSGNLFAGGTTTIDGLEVEDVELCALNFEHGAVATVRAVEVRDARNCGVFVAGANVRLSEISIALGEDAVAGVFASDHSLGSTSQLVIEGPLTSSASGDEAWHLAVDDGTELTVEDAVVGSGGSVGLVAFDAVVRMVEGASATFDSLDLFGVAASSSELSLRNVELTNARFGVFGRDSELTLIDSSVNGGASGITALRSTTDLRDVVVRGTETWSLYFEGEDGRGRATLERVDMHDGQGVGGLVHAQPATFTACTVTTHAGRGFEAQDGSTMDVVDSEVQTSTGAAIAFFDSGGSVRNTTFGGTLLASGRADEVVIQAEEGVRREVTLNGNHFVLDAGRDCTSGQCSLVLAHGADAVGIVMPNCLVAVPGEEATRTLVDQAGATLMVSGASEWADLLGGRGTDLGYALSPPHARPAVALPPFVEPGTLAP